MKSKIAQAIQPKYLPVAVILTNEKPQGATQFQENKFGCVAAMLNVAAKGRTAAFDRKTFGCPGGGVGLGFGNQYTNFPGRIENFLSTGNPEFCKTELGQKLVQQMPLLEDGEHYLKNPEIAKKMVGSMPMTDVPTEYVVFKPLENVAEGEVPHVVIFLANPDQLTALVVLAHYERDGYDNVIAPFGSACQHIGIVTYQEGESEKPRAVIGLTDITIRKMFDKDILSFSVPYKMYLEMEANVEGSFLKEHGWENILKRNQNV